MKLSVRFTLLAVLIFSALFAIGQSAPATQAATASLDTSGKWTARFGDSTQSGILVLDLKEYNSGQISGTYKSSLGGEGIVAGTRNGETLQLNLAQTTKDCPGTFTGTVHLNDANSGSGQFSGKDCGGDHANGVVLLTRGETEPIQEPANAAKSLEASKAQVDAAVSAEVLEERERMAKLCPNCPGVMIAYVDAQTGSVTYDWATKHQIEWAHKQSEEIKAGKIPAKFFFVKNRENAQYVIYWAQAVGYRPYVVYVPHTTTDTGTFNGSYNSNTSVYASNGVNAYGTTNGNFDGTVTVTHTDYRQYQGQRSFVNVTASVFDWKGKKLYQTTHQGNFRWSKPDKDCLTDAIEYLRKNLPDTK